MMRIREIDGLRAIAFLSVMLFHYLPSWFPGGYIGVDLFFVVSGFVITSTLKSELKRNGKIELKNFYVRRFFRIVPPLAVMLVFGLLVGGTRYLGDAFAALFSFMNWVRGFTIRDGNIFGHAWSLSIEEQFYVLWPFIFIGLSRSGRAASALVAAIVAIAVWRGWLSVGVTPERIYNGLDTHTDGLLLGCLIALSPPPIRRREWLIAATILLAICLTTSSDTPWMNFTGYLVVALCSGALLLAALDPSPGLRRLLNLRPMQWLGLRSYSAYLWHFPIGVLTLQVVDGKLQLFLATGLTLLMAELSFRFIEIPCGRLGRRFGRSVLAQSEFEQPSPATATSPQPHGQQRRQTTRRPLPLTGVSEP